MKRLIILLTIAAGFTACEDTIDLKIAKGTSYPVLDAWITDEPGMQIIRLTNSVPYTEQTPSPLIKDAIITLIDETASQTYAFNFNDSAYTFNPGDNVSIGVVGHAYRLRVVYKGETFEATDTIKRVTPVDSITYKYKTESENAVEKDGYFAKFHAKDIEGAVDYYWIRSYRNNLWHHEADEFSVDGYFDESVQDGASFVLPIQEGITDEEHPYLLNDKIIVKIRSLTYQSHFFLTQVDEQIDAGGLFAKVLENVRCNAVNVTEGGGTQKLLGWFGTSAVSVKEKTVQ